MSIVAEESFGMFANGTHTPAGGTLTGRWSVQTGNVLITDLGSGRKMAAVSQGNTRTLKSVPLAGTHVIHFTVHSLGAHINRRLIALYNGSTQAGQLAINSGKIEYNNNFAGQTGQNVILTTDRIVPVGGSAHISVKIVLSTTGTGSVEIRWNGVLEKSVSSVSTGANSQTQANLIGLGRDDAYSADYGISDFVVDNANFLGAPRVSYGVVNASGGAADWTPSAGNNEDNVDEIGPDEDSTYNQSSTSTDEDRLNMDFSASGVASIQAVCPVVRARKTDASVTTIKVGIFEGATLGQGNDRALSESYEYYDEIFETNPDTASAWTPTEAAAAQVSYENTS